MLHTEAGTCGKQDMDRGLQVALVDHKGPVGHVKARSMAHALP